MEKRIRRSRLIKKLLVLMAPGAVLAAIAFAPLSASADTFYKCPKGVTNHAYCTKIIKCVVPKLQGKTVSQARTLLAAHDCKLGKVTKKPGKGVMKGRIIKSSPSAGTQHRKGMKVDVQVRK